MPKSQCPSSYIWYFRRYSSQEGLMNDWLNLDHTKMDKTATVVVGLPSHTKNDCPLSMSSLSTSQCVNAPRSVCVFAPCPPLGWYGKIHSSMLIREEGGIENRVGEGVTWSHRVHHFNITWNFFFFFLRVEKLAPLCPKFAFFFQFFWTEKKERKKGSAQLLVYIWTLIHDFCEWNNVI